MSQRVVQQTVRFDVSAQGLAGLHTLVADVFFTEESAGAQRPIVLVCLPGGGMSRRYFDLDVAGADRASYSMARHLASRGLIVVTLDHPGVGDSDVPDDGYALTPHVVADIDALAIEHALDALRTGSFVDGLAALPDLRPVGCGHSMGGLVTVHQQARHRHHVAVALLGFAGGGLIDHLNDDERSFVDDPIGAMAALPRLAEGRFGAPYTRGTSGPSPFLLGVPIPDAALEAIRASGANLLNVCGLSSMIPGISQPELDAIDVPVFIGVGDHDITGQAGGIPRQFRNSRDVTLFVCEEMGHNHNVAPTRGQLWDRLFTWVTTVVQ